MGNSRPSLLSEQIFCRKQSLGAPDLRVSHIHTLLVCLQKLCINFSGDGFNTNYEQMSAFFDLLFNLYILMLSSCIIGNVRVANFAGAKNTNIVCYTKDFVIYRDAIGAQAD